ncbi:hypothetical protein [Paenibacillus terrae]|uniref:Uncharacterized protein n=1 Tax=Paenibacillus terrae TaxID=159743 RepID=A0A0D7WXS1_9BACL|nr:hypothetical protein [Paenibacillus terrae]KJD42542.1 hypothetical protein QD47_27540 [Paenibacillus terrae]
MSAKNKVSTYKKFKIKESIDITTGFPVFEVYTPEEWAYGAGIRSSEWDACSMKEAHEFIDSY